MGAPEGPTAKDPEGGSQFQSRSSRDLVERMFAIDETRLSSNLDVAPGCGIPGCMPPGCVGPGLIAPKQSPVEMSYKCVDRRTMNVLTHEKETFRTWCWRGEPSRRWSLHAVVLVTLRAPAARSVSQI